MQPKYLVYDKEVGLRDSRPSLPWNFIASLCDDIRAKKQAVQDRTETSMT